MAAHDGRSEADSFAFIPDRVRPGYAGLANGAAPANGVSMPFKESCYPTARQTTVPGADTRLPATTCHLRPGRTYQLLPPLGQLFHSPLASVTHSTSTFKDRAH